MKPQKAIMSRQSNIRGPKVVDMGQNGRPQGKEGEEKGMWSSMLDSVAGGKKLPEKTIVVLGRSQTRSGERCS